MDRTVATSSGSSSTHFETTTAFTLTLDSNDPDKLTASYSTNTTSSATVSTEFGSSISQSTEVLTCSGEMTRD